MAEEPIIPAAPVAAPVSAPVSVAALTAEEKAAAAAAASKEAVKLLLDPSGDAVVKIVKAKGSKNVTSGIVHVISTFNNTLVTVTDLKGNVIGWSSAGKMGSPNSRTTNNSSTGICSASTAARVGSLGLVWWLGLLQTAMPTFRDLTCHTSLSGPFFRQTKSPLRGFAPCKGSNSGRWSSNTPDGHPNSPTYGHVKLPHLS